MTVLERGDAIPHWHLTKHDGSSFSYGSIWQQLNLVLVSLPDTADANTYIAALHARDAEFRARRCECVITRDRIEGLHSPGVLVADKWGEIMHVAGGVSVSELPTPDDLLEWVDYVERRCPECEGEAR